jgi:hypothetical protein
MAAICGNPRRHSRPSERAILPGGDNVGMDLARASWLTTFLGCLIAVVVLLLQGYYGYASVTLAVALSAAINLV